MKRLDAMLREAGVTRAELSAMIGVSISAMTRWETEEKQKRARGIPSPVCAYLSLLTEHKKTAARLSALEQAKRVLIS